MSNKQASQAATTVAVSPVRAQRLAKLQAMLLARHVAAKQERYQAVQAAFNAAQEQMAKQKAFQEAVAQLQAQYGIALQPVAPRANSATTQPSPTVITIEGVQFLPTKAVHKLCELHNGNRKAVLEACKLHGINPATASTQYGVWRKANPVV